MRDHRISRRDVLALGRSGMISGCMMSGIAKASPAQTPVSGCGGVTREQFETYLTLFNNNDPAFIKYYHDDVVLELSGTEIKTPQGIRDFYSEVKGHIREKVELSHFVSDATGIAAELPTEFKVYKDWERNFFQRPLKAGEVLRTISFVLYWVENGKFKHIKSARYKTINDWRMEP